MKEIILLVTISTLWKACRMLIILDDDELLGLPRTQLGSLRKTIGEAAPNTSPESLSSCYFCRW